MLTPPPRLLVPSKMCSKTGMFNSMKKTAVSLMFLAGCFHGVAVHSKIYPIIYSLSYVVHASSSTAQVRDKPTVFSVLFSAVAIAFVLGSALSFLSLTFLSYNMYGDDYLREGLLYHFSRVDHRHNYSMFWYFIYLARYAFEVEGDLSAGTEIFVLSKLFFLPQAILLLYTSVKISPKDLGFCMFLQTFLFVALNKVITGQYFVWYLCLMPLFSHRIQWSRWEMRSSLLLLLLTVAVWLSIAFLLEMKGRSVHLWLFFASVSFFAANCIFFSSIIESYSSCSSSPTESAGKKKLQ